MRISIVLHTDRLEQEESRLWYFTLRACIILTWRSSPTRPANSFLVSGGSECKSESGSPAALALHMRFIYQRSKNANQDLMSRCGGPFHSQLALVF